MYTFTKVCSVICFMLLMAFKPCQAQNIDINWLQHINPSNPNNGLIKGISSSTYPLSIGLPVGLLAYGIFDRHQPSKQKAYYIIGSLVINTAVTQGLKYTIQRKRPYETYPNEVNPYSLENDPSFPSGHTSTAFALATSVSLQYKKWYVVVPAFAWAGAVGYSRMYLGLHYPSDVLAGALVGVGSAYVSQWLTKKIFK